MKEILAKLDQLIAGTAVTKTAKMNKTQFLAHIETEVKKAMNEEDEEKRKKRLEFVRTTVAELSKGAWEATEFKAIPLYEEPTTAKSERSESTTSDQSGSGSQGDTSFAANEGDVLKNVMKTLDDALKPETPAQQQKPQTEAGFWPTDVNNPDFLREGVNKRGGDWGADPWAPTA